MEYMTLKQYADQKGVTYESVRRLVAKYRPQLSDHIIVKDRVQYLDEKAIAFLSERRRYSPIVVQREDSIDRINELEQQVESLRAQLMAAQNELLKSKQEVIDLQRKTATMIETQTQYDRLLEDHQHTREELDQVKVERDRMQEELTRTENKLKLAEIDKEKAEQESQSYHKSWFGFYRKG